MDFSSRGQQYNSNGAAQSRTPSVVTPPESPRHNKKSSSDDGLSFPNHTSKWVRWGGGVVIIILAILLGAVLALMLLAKPQTQGQFIDSGKFQAVFLTNNQVYFGHITSTNQQYLVLNNIYYLQSSSTGTQQNASTNIALIKLGCELHKPYDQMIINQSQVTFWENLQTDGQVAKAITNYQKQNPNGQTCSNTANNSASGTSVQGTQNSTDNSSSSTTPSNTTNTKTTKP